jgi:hypothetical protein
MAYTAGYEDGMLAQQQIRNQIDEGKNEAV